MPDFLELKPVIYHGAVEFVTNLQKTKTFHSGFGFYVALTACVYIMLSFPSF